MSDYQPPEPVQLPGRDVQQPELPLSQYKNDTLQQTLCVFLTEVNIIIVIINVTGLRILYKLFFEWM